MNKKLEFNDYLIIVYVFEDLKIVWNMWKILYIIGFYFVIGYVRFVLL